MNSPTCGRIPGRLVKDPDFRCRCLGNAWAIDEKPCAKVQLAEGKIDVVDNFVYLGNYMKVASLPLLKDAALRGENLENSYSCLLVKKFL